jgi:hypothetical protein
VLLIKYLYGKSCYLDGFAKTGKSLWFRDLYTMDKLVNKWINDNEERKSIKVTSEEIQSISIAGRDFKMAPKTNFDLSITPPRCHVLCLSNKKNDPEMFDLFHADICIAIDVSKMVEIIGEANKHLGLRVVAGDVKYYSDSAEFLNLQSEENTAFVKPADPYFRESEYRIAIFWPNEEGSRINTMDDGQIRVFGDPAAQDDHIKLNFDCPEFGQIVVGEQRI